MSLELTRLNVLVINKYRKKAKPSTGRTRALHSMHIKICRCYTTLAQVMQGITGVTFAAQRMRSLAGAIPREPVRYVSFVA